MERLTENNKCKLPHGEEIVICEHSENDCNDSCMKIRHCKWYTKAMDKLKRYEDLEEQELILRLPYPLGTKYIYFVDEKDMDVYELDAEKIEVSMMQISKKVLYTVDFFELLFEDFGKIAFLAREEAEEKLKELIGGENESNN